MMGDSGLFIVVFIGGVGLYLVLEKEIKLRFTEYILTDRRVIKEFDFLVERTKELRSEEIKDMKAVDAYIGRLTGTKTVGINFEGRSGQTVPKYEFEIEDTSKYEEVKRKIAQIQPDVESPDPDQFLAGQY